MEKILVAIDGSENSHRALMKAKEIGKAFSSEITIINVTDNIDNPLYRSMDEVIGPLKDLFDKESKELIDNARQDFKDYSYKVNTLIVKGNPGYEITKAAEEGNYDLIVIGSSGLSALSRFMLGGVSHKVVNKAKASILVVK